MDFISHNAAASRYIGGLDTGDGSRVADSNSEAHIVSLDGLRGIAILLVLYYHVFGAVQIGPSLMARILNQTARWGWSGVDLFFVLSGFLITRGLLRSRDAANFYAAFYWRRVLRIFPLYYVAVVLVFFALPSIAMRHPERGLLTFFVASRLQLWFWLNVSNFWTAYFPMAVPLLTHFWSLAVEEQFYLLWPTVVRRASDAALQRIAIAGLLAPWFFRLFLAGPWLGVNGSYRLTPFHMEGLFGGALVALLAADARLARWRRWYHFSILAGVIGLIASQLYPTALLTSGVLTFFALVYSGTVALCVAVPGRGMVSILASRFLIRCGTYSYFIYVFHLMAMAAVREELNRVQALRAHPVVLSAFLLLGTFVLCFGLGALSHRFFEGPILSLKRLLPYEKIRQEDAGLAVPA